MYRFATVSKFKGENLKEFGVLNLKLKTNRNLSIIIEQLGKYAFFSVQTSLVLGYRILMNWSTNNLLVYRMVRSQLDLHYFISFFSGCI
jgi:hypothetical protein